MSISRKPLGVFLAAVIGLPTGAWADERRILDLLLKKHVITEAEYQEYLQAATDGAPAETRGAGAANPVEAKPVAEAKPAVETKQAAEAQKALDAQRASADKEAVADGEARGLLGALKDGFAPSYAEYDPAPYTPMLQKLHRQERFGLHLHNVEARYAYQPQLSVATGGTHSQFQLATAELEASGYLFPGLLFAQLVIEPRDSLGRGLGDSIAKNIPPGNNAPSGIVRDAFFDLVLAEPSAVIRFGQQRIPFGIEVQTPGGLLPFTSRSYLDLKLTRNAGLDNNKFSNAEFVQERDIGVQLRGRLDDGRFDYAVAAVNGAGINVSDTNNSKDVVGRLGYNPYRGLRFGVSGYNGTQVDILKASERRDRAGLDFELTQDLLPRFRMLGEAATGHDGPFTRRTWYLAGFYELIQQKSARAPGLVLGVRYDEMKQNVTDVGGFDDNVYRRWTVGLDYYFLNAVERTSGYWQQVKFQLDYEFRRHNAPTQALGNTDAFGHDLLMGQLTVRY